MIRKFIDVDCPKCKFSNGGYYEGDITPTRPMTFTCKRDRFYSEEDKKMYSSPNHCGQVFDIAITKEEYEEIFKAMGRKIIIDELANGVSKIALKDSPNVT